MLKIVYCIRAKPGVDLAKFYDYWLEQHGPKVKVRQKALRAVRYVQSHTVEPELNALLQQSRGLEPPYDGITEVWWNSADDLRAALATPEGAQAMKELQDDESVFIDFANSRLFLTQEHAIF